MEEITQLNRLITRIYTDDIFREYFFDNPAIALSYFQGISYDALESLRHLDKENIVHFAKSLKVKLCERVAIHYQPLFDSYEDQMKDIFSEFYADRKLGAHESVLNYSMCFGEFLKMRFFNIQPGALFDVVKFLSQKCQALSNSLPSLYFPKKEIKLPAIPCLAPNVFIESYSYEMNALIQDIQNPSAVPMPTAYLMMAIDETLSVTQLSMAAFHFLEECYGFFTVEFITNKLHAIYGYQKDMIEELMEVFIPTLLEKNIIYFK